MKKLTSFLGHLGTLILSVLGIVFLTQPHFTVSALNGLANNSTNVFGFTGEGVNEVLTAAYAFGIIATITLSLLIILSIINILADFNVIKNNKIVKVLTVLSVMLTVISLIAIFICVAVQVVDYNNNVVLSKVGTHYIGWGAIINFIISFAIMAMSFLADRNGKGKKQSKKK